MSKIIQLDPPLPVLVTSKDDQLGLAHFIESMGAEHHVLWAVAMNATGEVWWVPNNEIRMQANWSMDRLRKKPEGTKP